MKRNGAVVKILLSMILSTTLFTETALVNVAAEECTENVSTESVTEESSDIGVSGDSVSILSDNSAVSENQIPVNEDKVEVSENSTSENAVEETVTVSENSEESVGSAGSQATIEEVLAGIISNYDEKNDGNFLISVTDANGVRYSVTLRDDIHELLFNSKDESGVNFGHLDYDYIKGKMVDNSASWIYLKDAGLNIISLNMHNDLNQDTYKSGDILHFKYTSEMNSGYYNGNIQKDANLFYKKSLAGWDALLKAKTNHGLQDLGFDHFEEESTDDWETYFATKQEHFTSVLSGEQNAKPDNSSNYQSAWKKTAVTSKDRSGNVAAKYKIRIEEAYCGDAAWQKVYYENMLNTRPTDDQQWILFKYSIENTGEEALEAKDVLTLNMYCDASSKSDISRGTALSFTKDWKDKGRSSVVIQPGSTGYVWDGILMTKTASFPCLKLKVGYKDSKERYSYLGTNPDYIRSENTVTLNPNGGTVTPTSIILGYGDEFGTLPIPEKDEKSFLGWFTEENGGTEITETTVFKSTSDSIIYAHWSGEQEQPADEEHYTNVIEGSQNGTTNNMAYPQTAWMNTNATLQEFRYDTAIDYCFRIEELYCGAKAAALVAQENKYNDVPTDTQQWMLIKFSLKNNGSKTLDGNDVIRAKNFYSSTGTGLNPKIVTLNKNLNNYSRLTLEPGASGTAWIGVLIDKSVGFPYLKLSNGYDEGNSEAKYVWLNTKPGYGQCIVSFDANGGTVDSSNKKVYIGNPYGTLPTPVNADKTFDGWYTQKEGGDKITVDSIVSIKEAHTLYAHWRTTGGEDDPIGPVNPATKYAVSFYVSNNEIYRETVVSGEVVSKVPEPAGEGEFVGWYDKSTGKLWDQTMSVTRNIELLARFIKENADENQHGSGKDPALIIREGKTIYMVKGQSYAFPSKVSDNKITWKSSDPTIVKISSKYKAKALKGSSSGIKIYDGSSADSSTICYTVYVVEPKLTAEVDGNQKDVKKAIGVLVGTSLKLGVTGLNNFESAYDVTWISSNEEIAKVNNGKVNTYKNGTAKITAYINGKGYTVTISVKNALSITNIGDKVSLVPLQKVNMKFSDGFKAKGAEWTSDHEMTSEMDKSGRKVSYYQDKVVRITANGQLIAAGPGTTTLTGTNNGRTKTFTVTVRRPVKSIVYINTGAKKTIKLYNVNSAKASWTMSDNSIATVSNKGVVKGSSVGITKMTVQYDPYNTGGFEFSTQVYVEDPVLKSDGKLSVTNDAGTKGEMSLSKGGCKTLKLSNVYQPFIFSSNKNAVAFIDEAGIVYARRKGKATLSTKINGRKITVLVNVSD